MQAQNYKTNQKFMSVKNTELRRNYTEPGIEFYASLVEKKIINGK